MQLRKDFLINTRIFKSLLAINNDQLIPHLTFYDRFDDRFKKLINRIELFMLRIE